MKGERNTAPVGMLVVAVTSRLSSQNEAIRLEGGRNTPGGQGSQFGIINHPTLTATTG